MSNAEPNKCIMYQKQDVLSFLFPPSQSINFYFPQVSPVLFQEGLQKVPKNAIAIEIAPHCLLQAILKRSLGPDAAFVGLMKRFHENNVEFFFSSLGKYVSELFLLVTIYLHIWLKFALAHLFVK